MDRQRCPTVLQMLHGVGLSFSFVPLLTGLVDVQVEAFCRKTVVGCFLDGACSHWIELEGLYHEEAFCLR